MKICFEMTIGIDIKISIDLKIKRDIYIYFLLKIVTSSLVFDKCQCLKHMGPDERQQGVELENGDILKVD